MSPVSRVLLELMLQASGEIFRTIVYPQLVVLGQEPGWSESCRGQSVACGVGAHRTYLLQGMGFPEFVQLWDSKIYTTYTGLPIEVQGLYSNSLQAFPTGGPSEIGLPQGPLGGLAFHHG